jgi:hypothetical protein
MLHRHKQMNGIYPGLLHCFAVRNDVYGISTPLRHCEGEA